MEGEFFAVQVQFMGPAQEALYFRGLDRSGFHGREVAGVGPERAREVAQRAALAEAGGAGVGADGGEWGCFRGLGGAGFAHGGGG